MAEDVTEKCRSTDRGRTPIFFDPFGKRARRVTFALISLCILTFSGLLSAGVVGSLVPPFLGATLSNSGEHRSLGDYDKSASIESAMTFRSYAHGQVPMIFTRNRQLPPDAVSLQRLAFLPYGANAIGSFKRNAVALDAVIPDWLVLERSDARYSVRISPDARALLQWAHDHAPHLELMPRLTTSLSTAETTRALSHPRHRSEIVSRIVSLVSDNHFAGVVLDLDLFSSAGDRLVAAAVEELGASLRRVGRTLFLSAGVDQEWQDIRALAPFADRVLLRLHDQKRLTAGQSPLASQGWFEARLSEMLAVVPRHKIIVSVGNYGFDPAHFDEQRIISIQQAWDLAHAANAQVAFDRVTLNSSMTLQDVNGRGRRIWMLDAATGFNQIKAAMAAGVAGVALWQLGYEDSGIWAWLSRGQLPEASALEDIRQVKAGPGQLRVADGPLLSPAAVTRLQRKLVFDGSLGLVVDQTFNIIPDGRHTRELQAIDPKAVALTFDDGPVEPFTSQVLDILAEKGVPATFYVLGKNARAAPHLMQRIYDDGHDIGNHSYTHSDLKSSDRMRMLFELNATQRILDKQLGIRTKLFRAPYSGDDYQDLEATPHLIDFLSKQNYLVGGWSVDALDYKNGPEEIYRSVVNEVSEGKGQVVLLHDAGGRREHTIQALPRIIDDLRAAGYRFVTTHELAGLAREEVMPIPAFRRYREAAEKWIFESTLATTAWVAEGLPKIAIATAILCILRLLGVVLAAFTRRERLWHAPTLHERPRPGRGVTVLVPAFNEEKVIGMTVRGLLTSTIADHLEILVIDDGSSDRTAAVVEEEFAGDRRVRVLSKPNGGKSAALNYALPRIRTEVYVAIDGDTVIESDTIEKIVEPLEDPSVGAVAGKVVVGNRVNLLTRFQALEYAVSQNLDRRAFERFNAIGVVPGAIGAWRTEAVLAAGGYPPETLAEDADLTLTLQLRGWRIVSVPDALAFTEAPEKLRPLVKQRFRWTFGMLQVAWKHLPALLKRPTGVSMLTIPNILVFQFAIALLAPIMDIILVASVVSAVLPMLSGADAAAGVAVGDMSIAMRYWMLFQTIDLLACAAGIVKESDRTIWRLLPLVVVQRFTYRQILYWVVIRALLAAIKGSFVGWGKLIRTGTVKKRSLTSA